MKKALIIAAAAVLALVSCNKQASVPAAQNGEVRFTTNIQTYTVKATDTEFANGDQVGIFAPHLNASNVKATVSGKSLLPATPIKWKDGDNAVVKFYAYYPYKEGVSKTFDFFVKADQNGDGYTRSDLMRAEKTSAPTENAVELKFSHKLSKVVFKITNTIEGTTVNSVTFEGVYLGVGVDVETGVLTDIDQVKDNIIAAKDGSDYKLILIPQTASPKVRVVLSNGKAYIFALSSDFSFKSGKKATANLTVKPEAETGQVEFSLDVDDWTADEDEMEFEDPTVEEANVWTVVGKLNGKTWEAPEVINMTMDEYSNWSADITYAEGDEFKLKCGDTWYGMHSDWESYACGDFGNDTNYLTQALDSKNIVLAAGAGEYHLFFAPSTGWFVVTALGEPQPEPQPAEVWNIVGSFNEWADGVTVMTPVAADENAVEAVFTYGPSDTGFKFKVTGDWSKVKFYGPAAGADTAIDLEDEYTQLVLGANGNLTIAPGTYKAILVIAGEDAGKLYFDGVTQ